MICEVDSKVVRIESVYYRERRFGKEAPGYEIIPYRLVVAHDEFCVAFEEFYLDHVQDDVQYGNDADDIDLQLRKIGWPDLKVLLSEYSQLFQLFLTSSAYNWAIQELFKDAGTEPSEYLINTVADVDVGSEDIVFWGEVICIPKSPSGSLP